MNLIFLFAFLQGWCSPTSHLWAASAYQLAATFQGANEMELGRGVAVAGAILVGVSVVLQIINFFRPNPALHRQFADKDETERRLSALESGVKQLHSEVYDSEHRILEAGEQRAVKIHERVNAAVEEIGMLRGEVTHLTRAADTAAKAAHEAAIAAASARAHAHK